MLRKLKGRRRQSADLRGSEKLHTVEEENDKDSRDQEQKV